MFKYTNTTFWISLCWLCAYHSEIDHFVVDNQLGNSSLGKAGFPSPNSH